MKNQVLTSLISFGFAALLGSTPAAAQPNQTVTIPFTFEVNGVEYPEGNYTVREMGNSRVVVIRNQKTGNGALLNVPILAGKSDYEHSKLVFARTGERLTLREVWFAGHPGMMTMTPRANTDMSAKVTVPMK